MCIRTRVPNKSDVQKDRSDRVPNADEVALTHTPRALGSQGPLPIALNGAFTELGPPLTRRPDTRRPRGCSKTRET